MSPPQNPQLQTAQIPSADRVVHQLYSENPKVARVLGAFPVILLVILWQRSPNRGRLPCGGAPRPAARAFGYPSEPRLKAPCPFEKGAAHNPREKRMNSRKYEAIYIVRPELADGDVQKIADRFRNLVEENGGAVESASKWDKRRLAYPIGNFSEGNYVLMNFESGPHVPLELGRLLGIHDDVIRHRVFKVEEPKA